MTGALTVVDSSVALLWILPEPGAEHVFRYVKADDAMSVDILLAETANVLPRRCAPPSAPSAICWSL